MLSLPDERCMRLVAQSGDAAMPDALIGGWVRASYHSLLGASGDSKARTRLVTASHADDHAYGDWWQIHPRQFNAISGRRRPLMRSTITQFDLLAGIVFSSRRWSFAAASNCRAGIAAAGLMLAKYVGIFIAGRDCHAVAVGQVDLRSAEQRPRHRRPFDEKILHELVEYRRGDFRI